LSLCSDDELGYVANRTAFVAGQGLALDESYRLAHLPLVAPDHPRVIARRPGKSYDMGRHPTTLSLVLPVPAEDLEPGLRPIEAELRTAPFAHKIAWDILPKRRDRLHATLCSGPAPAFGDRERQELARLGPVTVELRGLFSGRINVGRLYARAYPERRDGANMFQRIQDILGCRRTDLYLVGLYNLTDDLEPGEAAVLSQMIERWWDRPLVRFDANALWLLRATDNLVLDSNVVEALALR
jgi:hypothetical protein